MLLGTDTRDDATALLRHLPALADQTRDRRDTGREWITGLSAPNDARPWRTCNRTGSPNGSWAPASRPHPGHHPWSRWPTRLPHISRNLADWATEPSQRLVD
jgi:hypothetical protein